MTLIPLPSRIGLWLVLLSCWISAEGLAQPNVDSLFDPDHISVLMRRSDLTMEEIEEKADLFFQKHGTGRGSGFKQYQRWLYERKFHLDQDRRFISPDREAAAYESYLKRTSSHDRTITSPWEELGPSSWNNTSGWNPGIGRITSVAIHPSNETIIYVSSPGGGIWKSINSGVAWTPLIDEVNAAWMHIYHLQIDPSNVATIYAAVMNPGGGVIKSTNGGLTWTATGTGPSDTRKVLVHPTNSSILFATAYNGIWRSVNGGTTWAQTHTDPAEDIEFKPGDPGIMYASSTSNSIRRSADNGLTWSVIGAAGGITDIGRTLLAVSPDNPAVVYAVQSHPNLQWFGRLYKSTNSGVSFVTTIIGDPGDGTNFFGYSPEGTDSVGQAWYDMAICVNPANSNEVHIAGVACWKSTDGGTTFDTETIWYYPNTTGYNHADVHALEYVNTTIYSGTDGGIYKSLDQGDNWTDLSAGLGIRQIYKMSHAPTDANRIVIGAQDNGTSYRQANGIWWDWLGADGMDNAVSPTQANVAYGMWQFGELNKTVDGGATRTYLGRPSPGNWVTPLVIHPTNPDILFGGWTGIYKSIDGGVNWDLLSGTTITQALHTLAVAPSNTDYIYGSVEDTLFRTSDGGSTWSSVVLPAHISSIFVSPSQPQKIWVTLVSTANQVQVSTNMGTTFTSISAGLPSIAARSVVVHEADPDGEGIYVGMNIGVYYRSIAQPAWVPFGTDLPLVAINELEIHESAGLIRVATYGRGIWENSLEGDTSGTCPPYAYVPNTGSNTVSVIDLSSNSVETTISVGIDPIGVCHSSDGALVYITNQGSNSVSVIQTSSQTVVSTVPLGANATPLGIDITPDDSKVFVANPDNGTVSVINTLNNTVLETVTIGGEPYSVQVSPLGDVAYVSDFDQNEIVILDVETHDVVQTIVMGPSTGITGELRFSPDGTTAFIQNGYSKIYFFNTSTLTVFDSVQFPSWLLIITMSVSPDGETLYVGYGDDSGSGGVRIVDIPTSTITGSVSGLSSQIGGTSLDQEGTFLYASRSGNDQVAVISTATHTVVTNITVGDFPTGRGDFVIDCSDPGGPPDPVFCGTMIYDSGGPAGNYGDGEDTIYVLCPDLPEQRLALHFDAFQLEGGYDFLKIFSGTSVSGTPLHPGAGYTGTNNPLTVTSIDTTGCLTLHFTSDGSITEDGWEATAECLPSFCGDTIYDSGGASGPYSNGENTVWTYCPDSTEQAVTIEFLQFDLESGWDYLKLFNGPTIFAPALHTGQGFTGNTLPGTFVSGDVSGCLTLHFTSDGSFTEEGWEAEVSCGPAGVCNSLYTDSGGLSSNYPDNADVTTVLCPDTPGDDVMVIFTGFVVEEDYDALYVYDGPDINSPQIHSGNPVTLSGFPSGGYYGLVPPGPFMSTHSSGCLTFRFRSDNSVTYQGWISQVECGVCSTHVTHPGNAGFGSLRAALACVSGGDTITFDATVNNQFIDILHTPMEIDRAITIKALADQNIKIRSEDTVPVFRVLPGNPVRIENVSLYGGALTEGQAVINEGQLILKNTKLYGAVGLPGKVLLNQAGGTITAEQGVEIRQ